MARRDSGLHTYHQLLEQRRDDAGRAVAEAQQQLQVEQERLQHLEDFRNDYQQSLRGQQGQAMTVADLRRYQHYIDNLDQAILHQAQRIVGQEHAVAACQEGLSAARRKELSVTQVLETRQRERQQRADKAEQAQADELANQGYTRRLRRQAEPENLD